MDLEEALRASNHRLTRPRQIVWDVLQAADRHLNAQEIAERVRAEDRGINVSSVYRTLTLFAEINLVRESRLEEDASTWETSHGDSVIHLVCTSCDVVTHHDARIIETLRKQLAGQAKFEAVSIDVRVSGRCENCSP